MFALKVSAVLAAYTSMTIAVPTGKSGDPCGSDSFWYGPKNTCLPNGDKDQSSPPPQQNCGMNWYWNKRMSCCVPPSSNSGDAGCTDGWKWDDGKYSCVPSGSPGPEPTPGDGQCSASYFWWKPKSMCLPHGGPSTPSHPPNGYQCPTGWYWHSGGHCAPREPDYGNPSCDRMYSWDNDSMCCKPMDH